MKDEELKFEEIESSHTLGYVTVLSDTLQSKRLVESVTNQGKGLVSKKSMDLCASESEERGHGVVAE